MQPRTGTGRLYKLCTEIEVKPASKFPKSSVSCWTLALRSCEKVFGFFAYRCITTLTRSEYNAISVHRVAKKNLISSRQVHYKMHRISTYSFSARFLSLSPRLSALLNQPY